MKLIQCIIQPNKLDDVVEVLQTVAAGMMIWEVRGYGHQQGHSLMYRGVEYEATLLPKMMIEIVAEDNRIEDIVKAVMAAARTGNIGDGRIFVLPILEAYHVRTGFMDLD